MSMCAAIVPAVVGEQPTPHEESVGTTPVSTSNAPALLSRDQHVGVAHTTYQWQCAQRPRRMLLCAVLLDAHVEQLVGRALQIALDGAINSLGNDAVVHLLCGGIGVLLEVDGHSTSNVGGCHGCTTH